MTLTLLFLIWARNSKAFHIGLPGMPILVGIVIVSVTASGVTGVDGADVVSPPAFFAVTVKVKLLPDVNGLTVTVLSVVSIGSP